MKSIVQGLTGVWRCLFSLSRARQSNAQGDFDGTTRLDQRCRRVFIGTLAAGLGLASLAAVLCIRGMHDVHTRLDSITQAVQIERQATAMLDQVSNSLIAFMATAVEDLSPTERTELLTRTDATLAKMRQSLAAFQGILDILPAEHQRLFASAIGSITHSWQALRDQPPHEMAPAEKARHFLSIMQDLDVVRGCLSSLQQLTADTTTRETASAFWALSNTIGLIGLIVAISVVISGFGALLVRDYLAVIRRANSDLAAANHALLAAKQAAEEASRAKSDFLSAFSHELRTPLNAIIGFSSLLQDQGVRTISETEQHEYIEQINASGLHLLNLINDILDFSKAGAGKLQLSEGTFRLGRIAGQAASMFRARCAEAGLNLVTDIAGAPVLYADERRVKQMLLNLLSNAVKFTQPGGTITVRATVRDGAPVISVTDTGIGIALEDMPQVMERFGQVDSSLSRRYEGTGLGLPLVAMMAELHGGRLQIESIPDEGTTASVTFPAARLHGRGLPYEIAA